MKYQYLFAETKIKSKESIEETFVNVETTATRISIITTKKKNASIKQETPNALIN